MTYSGEFRLVGTVRSPTVEVNGVTLSYQRQGSGPPVLLINPAASRSALWDIHQVPALVNAGYEVITFDSRGTVPSSVPPGPYRVSQLVADTAGLIQTLGLGPCRIAGASLGAMIAQELAVVRPDLVTAMALLGTRARLTHFLHQLTTTTAAAVRVADRSGAAHAAVNSMLTLFARRTLADDTFTRQWLEMATAFPIRGEGPAAQYEAATLTDRLDVLTSVTVPTLVVAFAEDVVTPPQLCREVADAIAGSEYVEVKDCGHYGFLEQPGEVNDHLVRFFGSVG